MSALAAIVANGNATLAAERAASELRFGALLRQIGPGTSQPTEVVNTTREELGQHMMQQLESPGAQQAEIEKQLESCPDLHEAVSYNRQLSIAAANAHTRLMTNNDPDETVCSRLYQDWQSAQELLSQHSKSGLGAEIASAASSLTSRYFRKILHDVDCIAGDLPLFRPSQNQKGDQFWPHLFQIHDDFQMPNFQPTDVLPFIPHMKLALAAPIGSEASFAAFKHLLVSARIRQRNIQSLPPGAARKYPCLSEANMRKVLEISTADILDKCLKRYVSFEVERGAMTHTEAGSFRSFRISVVAKATTIRLHGDLLQRSRAMQALMLQVNKFMGDVEGAQKRWETILAFPEVDDVLHPAAATVASTGVTTSAAAPPPAVGTVQFLKDTREFVKATMDLRDTGTRQLCIKWNMGMNCLTTPCTRRHRCCYCEGVSVEPGDEPCEHACFDTDGKAACARYIREQPADSALSLHP